MKFTPDTLRSPYATYAEMRAEAPIHFSDANTGRTWFIPRHQDVLDVLRDDRFSAALKASGFVDQFPEEHRAELEPFSRSVSGWIVLQDSPEHRYLRQLMNKGFARQLIESLRPRVTDIAVRLIGRMKERRSGDFMTDFAQPFPASVIASMFDIPSADLDEFISWSDDIVMFAGSLRPTLDVAHRAQDGLAAMNDFFSGLLTERRAVPGNDVLSLLASVRDGRDQLTDDQVLANCAQLIVAGHETTRNLVANGLWTLLQHPDQLSLLRENRGLMTSAIREIMRYESPLQFIRRVAREDFEYLGVRIRAYDGVVTMLGSANRDPERFPHPDQFDITRNPTGHVALGYGPHVCLGAALAEMETEVALSMLLDAFPNLRLVDTDPPRVQNPMLRAIAEMKLAW